jgi:uncharacterized protein DUF5615
LRKSGWQANNQLAVPQMPVLIDECVRKTVAGVFVERRHEVHYVARELSQGTADPLLAAAADQQRLILVTYNWRHFKPLISRRPANNQQQFRYAGLISFEKCKDSRTDSRIRQTIESIEFEYEQALKRPDKRLIVGIFPDELRIFY